MSDLFSLPALPFGIAGYLFAAIVVAAGYLIFAITGFGAAMLTVPVLSHFLPLPFVLPMSVMLDVAAAFTVRRMGSVAAGPDPATRRTACDWSELRWMVPSALLGALIGVSVLVRVPQAAALTGLGLCAMAYGAYSLVQPTTYNMVSRGWALVSGFSGGAMGTLFGIGAPPYAIYLARRLPDKTSLRATLTTMVLFSTGMRFCVFALAGLVLADRALAFLLLLPFMLLGLWAGHHLHLRMSRDKVLAAINLLLIAMGASLLLRAYRG